MLKDDLKLIERIFDFNAVLFTGLICSEVINFFWVWRLVKIPNDLHIYEDFWLRIFVIITTVVCYLFASRVFLNKKNSFLFISFIGCLFSVLATAFTEQFLTVTFEPLSNVNLFFLNIVFSIFFGSLISIFSFGVFALIKLFTNWLFCGRKALP